MQSTRRQLDPIRTTGEFPSNISMLFVASMLRLVSTSAAVLAGMVDTWRLGVARTGQATSLWPTDCLRVTSFGWRLRSGRKRLYSPSIGEQ